MCESSQPWCPRIQRMCLRKQRSTLLYSALSRNLDHCRTVQGGRCMKILFWRGYANTLDTFTWPSSAELILPSKFNLFLHSPKYLHFTHSRCCNGLERPKNMKIIWLLKNGILSRIWDCRTKHIKQQKGTLEKFPNQGSERPESGDENLMNTLSSTCAAGAAAFPKVIIISRNGISSQAVADYCFLISGITYGRSLA